MLKHMSAFTAICTLGMAFVGDFKGTVSNIATIVLLRGLAYLVESIIESVDKEMKGIANFTSYCLCGMAFIKILKAAQSVLLPLANAIS